MEKRCLDATLLSLEETAPFQPVAEPEGRRNVPKPSAAAYVRRRAAWCGHRGWKHLLGRGSPGTRGLRKGGPGSFRENTPQRRDELPCYKNHWTHRVASWEAHGAFHSAQ